MKRLFIIIFIASIPFISFSQNRTIDSLLNVLKTQKNDTNKAITLYKLSWKYKETGDADKVIYYANLAVKLSSLIISNTKNQAIIKTLKKTIANSYNSIGVAYYILSNYPKTLNYYLKSLKIREEIGEKSAIGNSYSNIGIVYFLQKNYNKSLEYYFKSIKINEKINNKIGLASCYNNIGITYLKLNDFEKSLLFYFKSLDKYKEINNNINGLGEAYSNIGTVYYKQLNFTKALEFFLIGLKYKEETGDKNGLAIINVNLAYIYDTLQDYKKSLFYCAKSLSISKDINNIDNLRLCYFITADVNSKIGNYKEAYNNYVKFKHLTDSIFNIENSKQLSDLKTNYEVEKKENELKIKSQAEQDKLKAIAKIERNKQQTIIYAIIAVLLIVVFFSIQLFRRFRITNKQKKVIELQKLEVDKANDILNNQNIEISAQRDEIELQKDIIQEEQKEILDSINYAKRIQDAILPPIELIKEKLPNSFVLYKPKDIVAGDFYWFHETDNTLFIAAADCTGHGVPGAIVSVVCSNALNRAVKEFMLTDTGQILDKVTILVLETFEKSSEDVKDGMDISLLSIKYINSEKNKINIQWSGAYNPLWYFQNKELYEIAANKQPIGKSEKRVPFTTHQIEYKPNTIFYLFTDGFADQFGGPRGKKFMHKQFKEKLKEIIELNIQTQQEILNSAFESWKNDLEQIDDVTIIGIKI